MPELHAHDLISSRLGSRRRGCRRGAGWSTAATSLKRRKGQGPIVRNVTLGETVLLVSHTWSRRRWHRAGRTHHASKTRQALATAVLAICTRRIWMRRRLREGERCAWTDRHEMLWRIRISWCHDTAECSWRIVESTSLRIGTQRSHLVSLIEMMGWRHATVGERSACSTKRRRLQAEISQYGQRS